MPQPRGAQGAASGASEDGPSGEALYNQGMAHYRRREWREARDVFLRLKALEPGRRGVDALLDELEVFIRFDQPAALPAAPSRQSAPTGAARRSARVRQALVLLAGLALVAGLAFLLYSLLAPRTARRAEELIGLARTHVAARNWSGAIDAYEGYLLLDRADVEARNGLWTAYYERGQERASKARTLEDESDFAGAAESWEAALADFRAAQQVDPGHPADPRGEISASIKQAENGRRLASLLALALDLSAQQRWAEAVQAIEAARAKDPTYHQAEVTGYLCDALLARAAALLGRAEMSAEVRRAVQMLEQAAAMRPDGEQEQVALRQARSYLLAMEDVDEQAWDRAVPALESLLAEEPDYAGGRAHDVLCRARWERAGAFSQAGRLMEALADYQAVAAAGCALQAEAVLRASEVALALTPTATPRPTARPTPLSTSTPAPSPGASAVP